MSIDYTALKSEIDNDPAGLGYRSIDANKAASDGGRFKGFRRDASNKLEVFDLDQASCDRAVNDVLAQLIAIKLNTQLVGSRAKIVLTQIPANIIPACFVAAEVVSLLPTLRAKIDAITVDGMIEVSNPNVLNVIKSIFNGCPGTLANIATVSLDTNVTRAKELFGCHITTGDVLIALSL